MFPKRYVYLMILFIFKHAFVDIMHALFNIMYTLVDILRTLVDIMHISVDIQRSLLYATFT